MKTLKFKTKFKTVTTKIDEIGYILLKTKSTAIVFVECDDIMGESDAIVLVRKNKQGKWRSTEYRGTIHNCDMSDKNTGDTIAELIKNLLKLEKHLDY